MSPGDRCGQTYRRPLDAAFEADRSRMSLAGFTLPQQSAYDPPIEGEGSIDPMGLAALSDRLANRLVPGVRARMRRVRFVTAMAVGAIACETLADELPGDGISTPAICFEWLVIEALVRRVKGSGQTGCLEAQRRERIRIDVEV